MIGEIVVYSIIAVFIGISQSAGIGGGPILNICLMVGFGYSSKKSMSITYLFLMGGAVASIWKNFKKINPQTKKLQMNYNLIMLALPMAASGSIFGALFNHLISEAVITMLFTLLLGYLSYDTWQKLKKLSQTTSNNKQQSLLNKEEQMMRIGEKVKPDPQLEKILQQELDPLPIRKIKIVAFIFIYTIIVLLFKGGQNYDSYVGLQKCGFGGYVLVLIHFVLSFGCSKSIAIEMFERDITKERLGFLFEKESDKMNSKFMWNSMLSGFCAGAVGGALGLGGAIILVPVWINTGIDKVVAASSSGPLIFFSAVIAFLVALLAGRYETVMQLVFYFLLAFAGAIMVRSVVSYIIEKYSLKSMIFILLLITMVSSLVVLLPFQITKFFADPDQFMEFGIFC